MSYTIDKHDLKLLATVKAEGPGFFMKHHRHEFRACSMRREGYLDGEMAVYSYRAGGSTELRTKYSITPKGESLLSSGAAGESK